MFQKRHCFWCLLNTKWEVFSNFRHFSCRHLSLRVKRTTTSSPAHWKTLVLAIVMLLQLFWKCSLLQSCGSSYVEYMHAWFISPIGLARVLQRIGGLCTEISQGNCCATNSGNILESMRPLSFSHIFPYAYGLAGKNARKYANKKRRQALKIITICEWFLAFSSWIHSCFHWLFGEYLFAITEVRVTKLFREKQLLKISDLHLAKFAWLKMAGWQIGVSPRIYGTSSENT